MAFASAAALTRRVVEA